MTSNSGKSKVVLASAFAVFVLLLGNGVVTIAAVEASSNSNSHQTNVPVKLGYLVINGVNYTVVEKYVLPESTPPDIAAMGNVSSFHNHNFGNDFQYGAIITDAYVELGAQSNFTYFNMASNPSFVASWIGATDNKGFFYQTGIEYNPSCTTKYQIWAVDNYPNGGNNGLGIGCSETSYSALSSSNWLNIIIFMYSGQWYYCWNEHGTSTCTSFPNGSDSGSTIASYSGNHGAAAIMEGLDNSSSFCTCYYTQGSTEENDLAYVNAVTSSGGTITLSLVLSSNDHFFETTGSGDAPPDSSAWSDSSATCDEYFAYHIGLPPNGASITACS